MFLLVLFWFLVVVAVLIGLAGVLMCCAAITGKADPTDHGNIVVFQFGLTALAVAIVPGVIALAIKLLLLA